MNKCLVILSIVLTTKYFKLLYLLLFMSSYYLCPFIILILVQNVNIECFFYHYNYKLYCIHQLH